MRLRGGGVLVRRGVMTGEFGLLWKESERGWMGERERG